MQVVSMRSSMSSIWQISPILHKSLVHLTDNQNSLRTRFHTGIRNFAWSGINESRILLKKIKFAFSQLLGRIIQNKGQV